MVIVTITVAAFLTGCILILSNRKNKEINELKTKVKVLQDFSDEVSLKLNNANAHLKAEQLVSADIHKDLLKAKSVLVNVQTEFDNLRKAVEVTRQNVKPQNSTAQAVGSQGAKKKKAVNNKK